MAAALPPAPAPAAAEAAGPRAPLRRVVIPAEHGSWSFLAEPMVLGLIAAPSAAGALLAVAAAAAFLERQPLRLLVSDRRRGKRYARTAAAEIAFGVLAVVMLAALVGAFALARASLLPVVVLAAPLGALALMFDLGRRTREAAAELVAALALGASAPGMALAAGWPVPAAFALWGLMAARSVPTILYVRSRLRLERGEPASTTPTLAAQGVAVAGVALLARAALVPWLAVGAVVVLGVRAVLGLSRWRPRQTTRQLGASEAVLGGVFAIAVGLALRLGR